MARLYTGQHGEFYVWIRETAFEEIRIDTGAFSAGDDYRIMNNGEASRRTGTTTRSDRINARRAAWERAGWVRERPLNDFPQAGDRFTSTGLNARLEDDYIWRVVPTVRREVPGQWMRVGQVRNWSFSNTAETIDGTVLGNTYREKLAGLKSITGQAQLMYYRERDDDDSPVSDLLDVFNAQDSELVPNEISVRFRLHHSSEGVRDYELDVIITNWSMSCTVGEVVTVDTTFESMRGPKGPQSRRQI